MEKKDKIIKVFDNLKTECSVNYTIVETGINYFTIVLETDILSYYMLYNLYELSKYSEFHIFTKGSNFEIYVPFYP